MDFPLIFRTIKHLKTTQVFHQVKKRLVKPVYHFQNAPATRVTSLRAEPIPRENCLEANRFTFLNLEHPFAGWNFTDNGMLWAYNQNYFDWINQARTSKDSANKGCYWIDKFITEVIPRQAQSENEVGLDSYPIALRCINWIKFFCRYPDAAQKKRLDSLFSQVKFLERKLEYHILGNHLLEDAYALFIAAVFFGDEKLYRKASKLLIGQLKEQVLPDGAHYEQSPMYHCILLDRLLDCLNMLQSSEFKIQGYNLAFDISLLTSYAQKMLGHLESVVWSDGSIPLLNDAAYGIAPTHKQIFDYAKRLGLEWRPIPMDECGYKKMIAGQYEAIVDVGNVTATYQPGHMHADSLNYELRIDGIPIVVDCGISTYDKTPRRQYERGTIAHNCLVIDGKNSSEVWGGFRVGKRCRVEVDSLKYSNKDKLTVEILSASHNGYAKPCKRMFGISTDGFTIEDWYDDEAVSYIHLAEGVDEKRVKIEGAINIKIEAWKYSTEYNRFKLGKEIKITFKNHLKYTIQ